MQRPEHSALKSTFKNRIRIAILMLAAPAIVAACAQSPDSIAPAAMPGGMYDSLSCTAARDEYTRVTTGLAALEAQQRSAVAGDAVGVFLIGVPMSSLTGGDKAGLIAAEKGKALALQSRLVRC